MECIKSDMPIDVSIIIVNYNTIVLLLNTIDSVIKKCIDIHYEIIVVDNNSSDNSEKIISEKYNNDIVYIKLPENIGFGRANNEGFKIAKGRNIFCLNPDTLLINNAVKILSDYLDNDTQVGVVGSQLYYANGTKQISYRLHLPSISRLISNFFFISKLLPKSKPISENDPTEVAAVVGAAMMIKKSAVDQTGGFNPIFFMYAEEDEWCYRISKQGMKVIHLPLAKITHLEGGSFTDSEQRMVRLFNGLDIYISCIHSPLYVKIYKFVYQLLIICNRIGYKAIGAKEKVRVLDLKYRYYVTKELQKSK